MALLVGADQGVPVTPLSPEGLGESVRRTSHPIPGGLARNPTRAVPPGAGPGRAAPPAVAAKTGAGPRAGGLERDVAGFEPSGRLSVANGRIRKGAKAAHREKSPAHRVPTWTIADRPCHGL